MVNNDRFDDRIKALVRSVVRPVPPAVEEKIRTAARSQAAEAQPGPVRRPLIAVSALVGAAALALAVWAILPAIRREPPRQIAEIRTEFVLPDKNITIIFVQKPDFPELVTAF